MDTMFVTYLIYVALSVGLTIWVARTLFQNGRIFLVDVFRGNEALADSVNRLLVVGFYLINLGYVSLALKSEDLFEGRSEAVEVLSWKVGLVLLVLGGMHFLNLYVFSRIRRNAVIAAAPPPVGPDAHTEDRGADEGASHAA